MWPLLQAHIQKHITISEKELEQVSSFFTFRKLRKRQFLLQEGDVCRQETFILKGCCRAYEIDNDGHEHVLQFALENWWIANLYSFLSETPSAFAIDCLEDCEVLQITKPQLEEMYRTVPVIERYFRLLIQNAFIALQQRIMDNLSKSGAERYAEFLVKYPHIEQRVPDHQVASYLGLTPQSLSRIRSRRTG